MSNMQNPLERASLDDADDVGPKLACILLLDTSGSMSVDNRIGLLNQGLVEFQNQLESDDLAKYRVDVAVVTFGGTVQVAQDFIPAADFEAAELTTDGATPMGAAINKALDMITERKDHYRLNGNPVFRPWIFMITDGGPTDDVQAAAARIKKAEADKGVVFFAVGVESADFAALEQLSTRKPWHLKGLNFRELFVWLSSSLSASSSGQPGAPKQLERPSDDLMV
jgi:uncharacterized protein YegL